MRLKTDARREGIMAAAADIFREHGYERTSMAAISARLGGSKATLYNYFKSKEELFAAVMMDAMNAQAVQVFALLMDDSPRVEETLLSFGRSYLDFLLTDEILALIRLGMAEGSNSTLGKALYETGPKTGIEELAAFIDRHMIAGRLKRSDPWIASLQFKGLIEAGVVEPSLYGTVSVVDREAALRAAIYTFLCAYQ